MKILLQDSQTKLYLGRGGDWTDKPTSALAFVDEVRARDYGIYHRLLHTQVVLLPETAAQPPATLDKADLSNEPNMKAATCTKPMNQPAPAGENGLPSAAMAASRAAEMAKEKKGGRTIAPKSQRSKAPKSPEQATIVEAKIDVGLGNSLFIRGQGAGLSWEKGLPLNCIDASTWVWSTKQAKDKLVFKLLLNDQVWARGADVVIEPGKKIQIVPAFH